MKKLLLTALCVVPFLCASLYAENADKEIRPQGAQPVGQSVGGNPNKGADKPSAPREESSSRSASRTIAPTSSVGPAPEHHVAPAGGPGHPRPVPPPPRPHAHYYYGYGHGHYYYADPYYYYPQSTTVIVYENKDNETVYYTAEVPDTIRLINEFPVKRSLAIQGTVGPYIMTSDFEGYDFSGLHAGLGLTYQIPINDHSLAFVVGAICTYRAATQTFDYYEDNKRTGETVRYTFEHLGIDVPLLLRLRGTGSRLSFDFGARMYFNVHDRLVTKDDSGKEYYHLSDEHEFANFGLTLGFNVDLTSFLAFNVGSNFIFGDSYNTAYIRQVPTDFSETELTFGLSFKIF